MSRLQLAIEQIVFARTYTLELLDQTPTAEWFRLPAGGVSHVAWQVGHLASAEYRTGGCMATSEASEPDDAALLLLSSGACSERTRCRKRTRRYSPGRTPCGAGSGASAGATGTVRPGRAELDRPSAAPAPVCDDEAASDSVVRSPRDAARRADRPAPPPPGASAAVMRQGPKLAGGGQPVKVWNVSP